MRFMPNCEYAANSPLWSSTPVAGADCVVFGPRDRHDASVNSEYGTAYLGT